MNSLYLFKIDLNIFTFLSFITILGKLTFTGKYRLNTQNTKNDCQHFNLKSIRSE